MLILSIEKFAKIREIRTRGRTFDIDKQKFSSKLKSRSFSITCEKLPTMRTNFGYGSGLESHISPENCNTAASPSEEILHAEEQENRYQYAVNGGNGIGDDGKEKRNEKKRLDE